MKILKEQLKTAGFDVIDEEVRLLWNPKEEDTETINALVEGLLN